MMPRGRPLIDIGYKYNVSNVLYFFTADTGIAKEVIIYLYNYPESFSNVYISLLLVPLSCLSYLNM